MAGSTTLNEFNGMVRLIAELIVECLIRLINTDATIVCLIHRLIDCLIVPDGLVVDNLVNSLISNR